MPTATSAESAVASPLDEVLTQVVEPQARSVDEDSVFPRAAIDAFGQRGLLGVMSAVEVGGMGLPLSDAALVVRRTAAVCGSTAMVLCMHYSAVAVIEAHGPESVRRAV